MPADPADRRFVSRGGIKLDHALAIFAQRHGFDVAGLHCADLGCSTGGFTDCLLQRHAAHVFSVDTAYGELAWKLRRDARVTVLERTNALPAESIPRPVLAGEVSINLVVIDLGWTKQAQAVPAAVRWLNPIDRATASEPAAANRGHRAHQPPPTTEPGRIISLVKPHYESGRHRLDDDRARAILANVLQAMPDLGVTVIDCVESPIRGGKGGNLEALALLQPATAQSPAD